MDVPGPRAALVNQNIRDPPTIRRRGRGLPSVPWLRAFGLLEPKHCLRALGPAGRAISVSRVAPGGPQCAAAQAGSVSRVADTGKAATSDLLYFNSVTLCNACVTVV